MHIPWLRTTAYNSLKIQKILTRNCTLIESNFCKDNQKEENLNVFNINI